MGNGVNAKVDDGFKKLINRSYTPHFEKYVSKQSVSAEIFHTSTGASSAARIGATVEATVSRKAVLSGAFGLVKKGAQIAASSRGNLYIGGALLAYEAYQAVKSDLESEGYEYKKESNEFYKLFNDSLCYSNSRANIDSCIGVDSSVIKALETSGDSQKSARTLLEMQVSSEFQKILPNIIEKTPSYKGAFFKTCEFINPGVSCLISTGTRFFYAPKHGFRSEVLTEEKFLQISTPSIDANPTPFVEGTGKPEYNEKVSVPAGTVVTIGPVTPENGKPVQITITFGQDSNGNTTAEVATTQRPDLTPGGSESPNTKPDPDPTPNPDGKPDKKPDDKPDSDDKHDKRPDDKPDPDDDPSDKRKEDKKEDKKDDKKEESKGLLCDFFPDILACDKMGKPEEGMFDAISIPQTTDDRTWSSDDFLPPNGVCPQPKSFNIWGKPVQISYEPLCVFMEKVRFAVLLGFIIMSAFIVFGSLRK